MLIYKDTQKYTFVKTFQSKETFSFFVVNVTQLYFFEQLGVNLSNGVTEKLESSSIPIYLEYCIEGISDTPNASADFYCQSNTNNLT